MARMRIIKFSELNDNRSLCARDYLGPSQEDVDRQAQVVESNRGRLERSERKLAELKAEKARFDSVGVKES